MGIRTTWRLLFRWQAQNTVPLKINVSVLQKQYLCFVLFCFEAGSHFISQAGLYLALLPQPLECKYWDNRCAHWLASCFQSSLQLAFLSCVWKKEHRVPEPLCLRPSLN